MGKSFLFVLLALLGAAVEARPNAEHVEALRGLLAQSEGAIDLANAKLAIDGMFEPGLDARDTLRQLDEWADTIRARFPPDASTKRKIEVLAATLYEPGPWNASRPFTYDYDNPTGIGDLSLSTYLATRKGQCVTMPTLVVLLGQKLDLPITLTTAPHHIMAKYGDEDAGQWVNLEATSGRVYDDGSYIRSMQIPEVAVEQGTYLRPHAQREIVALWMTAALGPVYKQMRAEDVLQLVELILEANPRDVMAMVIRANAHFMAIKQNHLDSSPDAAGALEEHARMNRYWYEKAESLGWKARTQADWSRYLEHLSNHKAANTGKR